MILYHYTSVESAIEIIKNSTLRLSDSLGMNDWSEGNYIVDLANPIIKPWLKTATDRLSEENWFNIAMRSSTYYISSFSRYGDLLQQWKVLRG